MSNFTHIVNDKVLSALKCYSMLEDTNKIIVGFSGGADSVCLLYVLNSMKSVLGVKVEAVHINHGIRGDEAKRDEDFSVSFCKKYNIPVTTKNVECISEAEKNKESLEECGRRLRYSVFESLCDGFTKIATAHNANDNAETVFFNLARGSSIKGVRGIPPVRDAVIRPLIYCTREEIEGFCQENGLKYVTDSTNLQDEYTRNKIRHNVIPALIEINPSAISNILNFCDSAKSVWDFLSCESQKALEDAFICENTYDAEKLKKLHTAVLNETIAKAFSGFSNHSLDRNKIGRIVQLIHSSGRLQLYGEESVEVVKGRLRFYHCKAESKPEKMPVNLYGDYTFGSYSVNFSEFTDCLKNINKKLLDNLIDYDKINGNLFLRTRDEGDKFSLYKRNISKSLKNLFNELSIPVEERNRIPVLCDDDGIVWIYSIGVCNRCHVTESSSNIICVRGENNGQ